MNRLDFLSCLQFIGFAQETLPANKSPRMDNHFESLDMKKFCCMALLCVGLNCHAEWTLFMEMEDGTWYVDLASRSADAQPRIWTLFDHKTPVGAFGVRSVKTWLETDCQEGWLREKSLVVFNDQMARGSILRNTSPGTMKIFPQPGSAYEKISHSLCQK